VNAGAPSSPVQRRPHFFPASPSLYVRIPTGATILTGLRLPGRGGSLATGSIGQPGTFSALRRLLEGIPDRRRIFVSYHHARDQGYYDALARMCGECDFLTDRSVDRILDSDNADYQERRIREEFIQGSSATVVLCGLETFQRKWVDWEIFATLHKESVLIGVQLPNALPPPNSGFLVPARLHQNIQSGYAQWVQWNDLSMANLRLWIEAGRLKSKTLIQNGLEKKKQNG
jgi:hypothetical protein